MAVTREQLLDAAFNVYGGPNDPAVAGFTEVQNTTSQDFFTVDNTSTSLYYKTYRNAATNEYIISFRGSAQTKDWLNNTTGGWFQFEQDLVKIRKLLDYVTTNSAAKVNITGHSLGGALAQFAAYDFVARSGRGVSFGSEITLTTWNALGGQWALTDNSSRLYGSAFNSSLMANVGAEHYARFDDLVSELGDNHVGGSMNTLGSGAFKGIGDAHNYNSLKTSLNIQNATTKHDYLTLTTEGKYVAGAIGAGLLNLTAANVFTGLSEIVFGVRPIIEDKKFGANAWTGVKTVLVEGVEHLIAAGASALGNNATLDQLTKLWQGLDNLFGNFGQALAIKAKLLPLVGNADANSQGALRQLTDIHDVFRGLLGATIPGGGISAGDFLVQLNVALAAKGLDTGLVSFSVDASGVTFDLNIDASRKFTGALDADFGVGKVLNFQTTGNATLDAGLSLDLSMGVDGNGFYLNTEKYGTSELFLGVRATLPSFTGKATLFDFLGTTITDKNSSLNAGLAIDLMDRKVNGVSDGKLRFGELTAGPISAVIDPKISGTLDLNLGVKTDLGTTKLPSISTDLAIDWVLGSSAGVQIGLTDVKLDLGEFIGGFAKDVAKNIQPIITSVRKATDTLTKPIGVLESIGFNNVSLLDIAQMLGYLDDSDRRLIESVKSAATLVDRINTTAAAGYLNLGDFKLPSLPTGTDLSLSQGANEFKTQIADGLQILKNSLSGATQNPDAEEVFSSYAGFSGGGFSFPLIENPKSAVQFLLGKDIDLFKWDLPKLAFGFSLHKTFPVFGPFSVGGGIRVEGGVQLGIGFDTSGLREYLKAPEGSRPAGLIAQGFYLSQYAGEEIYISTGIEVKAGINIGIASAYVGAGIYGTVGLDLRDPDKDGKLHFSEIGSGPGQVPNFFRFAGRIEAGVFGEATIGWGWFSKTWRWEKRVTLLEFGDKDNNEPVQVGGASVNDIFTLAGGVVSLSGSTGGNDVFTLLVSPDDFSVWRGDNVQKLTPAQYNAVTRIVGGDLGAGNDQFFAMDVAKPITVAAGAGDDTVETGTGADSITGGDGIDDLRGNGGNDSISGGTGNDVVFGDKVNDTIGGNDVLSGDDGNDRLYGGRGNDSIQGGAGMDYLEANEGNDTLLGGGDNDELFGLAGDDSLVGGSGNDVLNAGEGANTLLGEDGADELIAGIGSDLLVGGTGNDFIDGGGGNNTLVGGSSATNPPTEPNNSADSTWDVFDASKGTNVIYGGNTDFNDAGYDVVSYRDELLRKVLEAQGIDYKGFAEIGVTSGEQLKTWLNGSLTLSDLNLVEVALHAIDIWNVESSALVATLKSKLGLDAQTGISLDLSRGVVNGVDRGVYGGAAAGDHLYGIEQLEGTDFADTIIADGTSGALIGNGGNDLLRGGDGFDLLDGGSGADTLDGDDALGDELHEREDPLAIKVLELAQAYVGSLAAKPEQDPSVDIPALLAYLEPLKTMGLQELDANAELKGMRDVLEQGTSIPIGALIYFMQNAPGTRYVAYEDIASYEASPLGVNVNLITGIGTGGDAEGDKLSNIEHLYGSNSADVLTGDTADNMLRGNDGNDTIYSGDGRDSLIGGQGTDVLVGGKDSDIYYINEAADSLVELAGEGVDEVFSAIDYTLPENVENVTLLERVLNEYDVKNWRDNQSTSGNIDAGEVEGTPLNQAVPVTALPPLSATGNAGRNFIRGNSFNNTLRGGSDVDRLFGYDGDDLMDGGEGADQMEGGRGNDTYIIEDTFDLAIELKGNYYSNPILDALGTATGASESISDQGNDTAIIRVSQDGFKFDLSLSKVSYVETVIIDSFIRAEIIGNEIDNTLVGGIRDDILRGGDGNDWLDGRGGYDRLVGGNGNDTYVVGTWEERKLIEEDLNGGVDWIHAPVTWDLGLGTGAITGFENLRLLDVTLPGGDIDVARNNLKGTGNRTSNQIAGNDGDNVLVGMQGNDSLYGAGGNDTLRGDTGRDLLDGGSGNDTADYSMSAFAIRIGVNGSGDGDGGIDTLAGIENIIGSVGNDSLAGDINDNILDGRDGNDTITAGGGSDTLLGGIGNDSLSASTISVVSRYMAVPGEFSWNQARSDALNRAADMGRTGDLATIKDESEWSRMVNDAGLKSFWLGATDSATEGVWKWVDGSNVTFNKWYSGSRFLSSFFGGNFAAQPNDKQEHSWTVTTKTERSLGWFKWTETTTQKYTDSRGEDYLSVGFGGTWQDLPGDNWTARDNYTTKNKRGYYFEYQDTILSGSGATRMEGGSGNDTLQGANSNDWLNGGAGDDRMIGFLGDDIYFVDSANDVVNEGVVTADAEAKPGPSTSGLTEGGGYDEVRSSVDYWLQAGFEALTLLDGAISGTGNGLGNSIYGNAAANVLEGRGGNDYLDGKGGADTMRGGTGDDSYTVDNALDLVEEAFGQGSDYVEASIGYTLSSNVERLYLWNSSASVLGQGNNLNNTIYGSYSAGDTLRGLDGNDTLHGTGGGNDLLVGGTGNDVYHVAYQDDRVSELADEGVDEVSINGFNGASRQFILPANVEHLSVSYYWDENSAGLKLSGNSQDNRVSGSNYADTLDGGTGADTLRGGDGDDYYVVDSASDLVQELSNDLNDSIESSVDFNLASTPKVEHLRLTGSTTINATGNGQSNRIVGNAASNVMLGGGGFNDTLEGGAGNDSLVGGAGNDRLDGGTGIDTMVGGAGSDTYVVDNVADRIEDSSTNLYYEVDTIISSVAFQLPANIENLELTGTGNLLGVGNDLANALKGNDGNNNLRGGNGNDVLDGGTGADTLEGGNDDDTFYVDSTGDLVVEFANAGFDVVYSSANILLPENVEQLFLTGAANATGNADANQLTGSHGNDTLDGKGGEDTMFGSYGNDVYVVDNPLDVVIDERADLIQQGQRQQLFWYDYNGGWISRGEFFQITPDILLARAGIDLVKSSVTFTLTEESFAENLELTGTATIDGAGNSLDNKLTGNAAANLLVGGDGDDTLRGMAGADTLEGGEGNDYYVVEASDAIVLETAATGYYDTVESTVSFVLPENLEMLVLKGGNPVNGTGNDANNSLLGNATANNLEAGSGGDTLEGGGGGDTLAGGTEADLYIVRNTGVTIRESATADGGADTVRAWVDHALATGVETLDLQGTGNISGAGNIDDNLITGNMGNNVLNGGGGQDTMRGGAGSDTYVTDSMHDVIDEYTEVASNYQIIYGDFTWENAKLDAEIRGGHLATATSLGEWLALQDVIKDRPMDGSRLWLGATDSVTEGAWKWVTGETWGFTAWADGQPDGAGENADYLEIGDGDGSRTTWNAAANDAPINPEVRDDEVVPADEKPPAQTHRGYILETEIRADRSGKSELYGHFISRRDDGGIDGVLSTTSYILPEHVEKLTLQGNAIAGTGNSLPNQIIGNARDNLLMGDAPGGNPTDQSGDTLNGGLGKDKMFGGFGNDLYVVDSIGDEVNEIAGAGIDTIHSYFSYSLDSPGLLHVENLSLLGIGPNFGVGNAADNRINGNAADNRLYGLAGNDVIAGGEGSDTLNGGSGTDTMSGGNGNDYYFVDDAGDKIGETGATSSDTDTVGTTISQVLGENLENLVLLGSNPLVGTGNALGNNLTGNTANNVLSGGSGSDTLSGGGGGDAMFGGPGNDTYVVDNDGDIVTEAAAEGTDTVQSTVTHTLAANVEYLVLTGTAAVRGTGNALNNSLTGNNANNSLNGGIGNDTMAGGLGNDSYGVDANGDVVAEAAEAGLDVVYSTATYTLAANVENLVLTGTATIRGTGNVLNNSLSGNAANNSLVGGTGNDTMAGGAGDDSYGVDSAGDVVVEAVGAGMDIVYSSVSHTLATNVEYLVLNGSTAINGAGNASANRLTGNTSANVLSGLGGGDLLTGGGGNDLLNGGDGDDSLHGASLFAPLGAAEIDTLTGGTGNDTFILGVTSGILYNDGILGTSGTNGYALITDFSTSDKLQLKGAATEYRLGASPAGLPVGQGLFHDSNASGTLNAGDELIAVIQGPNAANALSGAVVV